jgi:hypothetical protein
MADTTTLPELARMAGSYFYQCDGAYQLTKNAPAWVRDMVRDAHCGMVPDDWRYATILEALNHIAECADTEDILDSSHDFADLACDVYSSDLLCWVASSLQRVAYVDNALEEFGHGDRTLLGLLQMGQYYEATEIYDEVLAALRECAAEQETTDD